MPNERIHIAIIGPSDKSKVCFDYLFQIFKKSYGHTYQLIEPGFESPQADIWIVYGEEAGLPDQSPVIRVPNSGFFGNSFGQSADAPAGFSELVAAASQSGFDTICQREGHQARLQYDVLAASFYMLSGYFEYYSKERDHFGRLLSSQVPVPVETWALPVVNYWMGQLDELINSVVSGVEVSKQKPLMPGTHTVCLTHDIDLLRKYRTGNLPRQLVRAAKAGNFSAELGNAKNVLSGKQRDPYDCFDQLYTVKERVSAPSTFFFMGCEPGSKNGDYRVSDRDARNLIVRAKSFDDEIGLHGSWESADSPALIEKEKMAVDQVAGLGTVKGARQHYLRFNNSRTWSALENAGIRYDSTGGFPDRCGFKYGWSGCFRPFDLSKMAPSSVIEIPLVCMDVTLAAYEKIPAELALERLTNMLDAACERVPGGAFVFLWHNTMGDKLTYPGYWDTFEYFFSVASGSARFLTLSHLCDEYEARP